MTDDINAIAARMREAIGGLQSDGYYTPPLMIKPSSAIALLDDWERRGRREREAVDFSARAAALDRRRIVEMLDLKKGRQTALDALAALAARVAELTEALKPFTDYGDDDSGHPDNTPATVSFGPTTWYALTLGDLRRARAVLAKKG